PRAGSAGPSRPAGFGSCPSPCKDSGTRGAAAALSRNGPPGNNAQRGHWPLCLPHQLGYTSHLLRSPEKGHGSPAVLDHPDRRRRLAVAPPHPPARRSPRRPPSRRSPAHGSLRPLPGASAAGPGPAAGRQAVLQSGAPGTGSSFIVISLGVTLGLDPGQRALRLYHLYRLSVGLLLVMLISSNLDDRLLQVADAPLFRFGSWAYLIINIFASLLVQRAHSPHFFALALLDVLLLGALFYAGGGPSSGLGSLMIIAVAIANLLLRGRSGLLIAAVAALAVVLLTFHLALRLPGIGNHFLQAGALGALCFAVALTVQSLARRLQISERLA